MTIKDKLLYGVILLLFLTVIGLVGYNAYQQNKFKEEMTKLNNQVSELTPTMKILEGTYARMVVQNEDLIKELTKTNKELADKLKKMDLDLLQVTKATISMQAQVFKLSDKDKTNPNDNISVKTEGDGVRVEFDQTQGYFNLKGYTLSKPLKSEITLSQVKALEIMTTLVRNDKGNYEAMVTFPQDFPIKDYKVTAQMDIEKLLDPYQEKWYNKFWLGGSVYAKQTGGALITADVSYKISKFLFGISIGVDTTPQAFYGIGLKYNVGGK